MPALGFAMGDVVLGELLRDRAAAREKLDAAVNDQNRIDIYVVIAKEQRRPDALEQILRGRAVLLKPWSPDTFREAINLLDHALELDPQSVEAQSRLAGVLAGRVLSGWAESAPADLARLRRFDPAFCDFRRASD